MQKLDSLGRATFHHIAPQGDVCPTNREVRWLKHIERHGPQSSVYLHELTSDTHRCQDTSLRQLQRLRAGGFLMLPRQQRATERAEFNPYIYDLTAKARYWLADREFHEPTVRPTGHFWHSYTVSCITSSIEIAATNACVRFILSTAETDPATRRRKTRPVAGRHAAWRARWSHIWRVPWRLGPQGQFCKG